MGYWTPGIGPDRAREPAPNAGAVSLPEPQEAPYLDLTGISPPDPVPAGTARASGT
jgi:hypothetical protein